MSTSKKLPSADEIKFRDMFGIFVRGPDEVEFRTGSTSGISFVASDPARRGLLGPLVQMILSNRIGQTRPLNEAERELLGDLIPKLEENGIIELDREEQALPVEPAFSIPVLQTPLSEAHLYIVGHGVLGAAVARHLEAMRCRLITIVESSSVAQVPSSKVVDSWSPREQAVEGVTASANRLARPARHDDWLETIKDADWIIAAQDCFEPEELAGLNKATLERSVPWSLVCFDGYEGWVGPTFVPGQTACFSCFRRRLFANAGQPKHVMSEPGVKVYRLPSPLSVGPEAYAWVSLITSIFALELSAAMNGRGFTIGQLLVVHRLNLTFYREAVLRLPRCQDCSPRRESPNLNVFSHILATRGVPARDK